MSSWVNDGGHGGNDGGASHGGFVEKVYTLEASLYVDKRLKELGIKSTTTRTGDVTLTNNERTGKVKKHKKCISHHFNAGGGHGAEFIHSIHSNGVFEKMLVEEFKSAGYPLRNTPVYTRTLPNNKSKDYYFMNRETGSARTTIVEYDFVDGKNLSKLKDKSYREGMYECVIKAICRDEKVTYFPPNVKVDKNTFYRVVTGSFNNMDNAEKRMQELKSKGFKSFLDIYKK